MIGIGESNELLLGVPSPALVSPVLERHLEGDLDGRGPVVRKEDTGQVRGRELDQLPGQLRRGDVGQSKQAAVIQPVQLAANGSHDVGMGVAMDVGPERRDSVQILPSPGVVQVDSPAPLDHQLRGFHPLLHLSEGMPQVSLVQPFEIRFLAIHGRRLGHGLRVRGRPGHAACFRELEDSTWQRAPLTRISHRVAGYIIEVRLSSALYGAYFDVLRVQTALGVPWLVLFPSARTCSLERSPRYALRSRARAEGKIPAPSCTLEKSAAPR